MWDRILKGRHFYNRRFSTTGKGISIKRNIDKYPFLSLPATMSPEGKEKGGIRLRGAEGFAVRRLKSTVIEMASLRDAIQLLILSIFARKICVHPKLRFIYTW